VIRTASDPDGQRSGHALEISQQDPIWG